MVVVACILALAAVTVGFGVSALHHDAAVSRMKRLGVPVQVTVTGCVAMGTGTAETIDGYQCQGSFTLDGRTRTAPITGTDLRYPTGATLAGVVERDDPGRLATAASVSASRSSLTGFVTPAVSLGLLVVVLAGVAARRRRPVLPAEG